MEDLFNDILGIILLVAAIGSTFYNAYQKRLKKAQQPPLTPDFESMQEPPTPLPRPAPFDRIHPDSQEEIIEEYTSSPATPARGLDQHAQTSQIDELSVTSRLVDHEAETEAAALVILEEFDLHKAVIYSAILEPKFENER
ncbi:MAG: hypothetical protein RR330_07075 [Alistipes sp.]